jgi:uncharacterized protein with HEPN domain
MTSKHWRLYAQHILDCIDKIDHIKKQGSIANNSVLYDATLRNLQTLAEATQRLPEDVKLLYPDIPWRQISDFRNVLVHEYLGNIDPVTVMGIVDTSLATLKTTVIDILNQQ